MTIHHICIQTDNYSESLRFYTEVLGFKLIQETAGFNKRDFNSWLVHEGFMIELQTQKNGEDVVNYFKNANGIAHICFYTNDIKKKLDSIKEKQYYNFQMKNQSEIYSVLRTNLFKVIAPEGTIIEFRDSMDI